MNTLGGPGLFIAFQKFTGAPQNKDILENTQIFENSLISWEWDSLSNSKILFVWNKSKNQRDEKYSYEVICFFVPFFLVITVNTTEVFTNNPGSTELRYYPACVPDSKEVKNTAL